MYYCMCLSIYCNIPPSIVVFCPDSGSLEIIWLLTRVFNNIICHYDPDYYDTLY